MNRIAHILIDLIADLTEPISMDSEDRSRRDRRIREAHEAVDQEES